MKSYQKQFIWVLLISAFIWSIVPLLRQSLPMDTQEAIVWGKYCLWGTTKHPPLSGWIAYNVYRLFGHHDFAMYLLNQVFVLMGIAGIYKLAKHFLPPLQAVLAAAFQLGILLYHFSATEFNVNVISLAIWPWCTYYFWQAYRFNKLKHWLLFGALMGVNVLNKYVGGLLAVALVVFVLITPQARTLMKNPKAYISVCICILICLPHLLWLYDHDFAMLGYIATRNPTGKITSILRHFAYPLKFLSAQLLFVLPAAITFVFFTKKQPKETTEKNTTATRFLLCICVIPTLFWVSKAAIFGAPVKSMWNFPSLFAWGICAFYFIRREWSEQKAKNFIRVMLYWSCFFALIYGGQCLFTTSLRFQSDCKQITRMLTSAYKEEAPTSELRYVAGNIWFSDMVNLYAPHEVKPVIWVNIDANPWFDKNDFEQSGALVVAESVNEYETYRQKVGDKLTPFKQSDIIYHNYFGKKKTRPVYWGVYQGEKNEK